MFIRSEYMRNLVVLPHSFYERQENLTALIRAGRILSVEEINLLLPLILGK